MMHKAVMGSSLLAVLAACSQGSSSNEQAGVNTAAIPQSTVPAAAPAETAPLISDAALKAPAAGETSIVRLDCGTIKVDDFSKRFSDQQIYPHGSKRMTDSCYLITHNGQRLLWDTGLPVELLNSSHTEQGMTASLTRTIPDQLKELKLTPADINIVGISHRHFDHTGQAAAFPVAKLLIGTADFADSRGKDDPFGPWRTAGAKVAALDGDSDVFGDGQVVALFLPGHTPGHHALLVKLKSGDVMLSGDLYHATEAREKRGVPPFNTSREQTLKSMDRFEVLAKELGAKVIIQHEPADIAKLPAFPAAAR